MKSPYSSDIDEIKKVITQTIHSAADILSEPPFRIGVIKLETDRYTLSINIWVNASEFYDTLLVLQKKFLKDLKAAGKLS